MYNVAQSAIVERVMLAPKAPFVGSIEAIEGYEDVWKTANTDNHAILPFNAFDGEGNPLARPERVSPAQVETGLSQIAQSSSDDIKNETGQYDASLGQRSNETSGKAIMARQREGDTATFHYVDNLARAVRHIGRIILDMIPQVYDSRRVARILGEDGSAANAVIDTEHPEALTEVQDDKGDITRIFNPTIGTYDVHTTTGPSFNTRRVEAVDAMTAMTQANPQLWQVIGDQLVKNMDWPGAEEMAERLKLTLLPQVQASINKNEGKPDPAQLQQQVQQMTEQIKAMGTALENADKHVTELESSKELEHANLQLKAKEVNIKEMAEQTKRMQVERTVNPDPDAVDQTAIAVAQINAQSAERIAMIQAGTVEPEEEAQELDEETGEPIVKTDPTTELLSALVQSNQQIMQVIAASLQPKTASIQINKQPDGSFVGQRIEA